MVKKSEKKEDLKKTLALIFVEGDTEVLQGLADYCHPRF